MNQRRAFSRPGGGPGGPRWWWSGQRRWQHEGFSPRHPLSRPLQAHDNAGLCRVGSSALGRSLWVPQLVQNVFDAVTDSVFARQILALPETARAEAIEALPLSVEELTGQAFSAEGPIYWAMVFIVVFSLARGLFAFAQAFLAQKVSQDLAFDFRNELFEKIQRLSFSYHDRNRTGPVDDPRH